MAARFHCMHRTAPDLARETGNTKTAFLRYGLILSEVIKSTDEMGKIFVRE